MKLLNFIFWLPTMLVDLYKSTLAPRWLFKATYKPSTDGQRKAENTARNAARLAAYKAKRSIYK